MPNIHKPDSVPVHFHSPEEIAGVQQWAGPPTDVVMGETEDPIVVAGTFADLPEMTFTVPATLLRAEIALRWQITARFSSLFTHTDDGGGASIKFVHDGVDVPGSTRTQAAKGGTNFFSISEQVTVEVDAETATQITIQWANTLVGPGSAAQARGTERRLELDYRPLTGVTP